MSNIDPNVLSGIRLMLLDLIPKRNKAGAAVAAATVSKTDLAKQVWETSDDEAVTSLKKQFEKAEALIASLTDKKTALLTPLVDSLAADSKADPTEFNGYEAQIKAMVSMLEVSGVDVTTLDLPAIEKVKGTRASNGTAAGSTGTKRIRGYEFTVDGKVIEAENPNKKGVMMSNPSVVSKATGIEVQVIQEAFFAAAGGNVKENWPASFSFTLTGAEDKIHQVSVRKVETAKADTATVEA